MKASSDPERHYRVLKVDGGSPEEVADRVVVEEPMEVRVRWQAGREVKEKSVAITMRTPGDDFELVAGFLYTERVVGRWEDIVDVAYCLDVDEEQERNIVTVTLAQGVALDVKRLERNFFANSSCGVCGKATLEALDLDGVGAIAGGLRTAASVLRSLPGRMRERQGAFEATGGLHAAALFDADGNLESLREDVGRHNAVDKVIGERLILGRRLEDCVLLVSGRAGFEIVQKALVGGVPVVAAVGAPSSLAVDVAERFGMTLVGFLRDGRFNVYAHAERIVSDY